jgi:hypothetical protein
LGANEAVSFFAGPCRATFNDAGVQLRARNCQSKMWHGEAETLKKARPRKVFFCKKLSLLGEFRSEFQSSCKFVAKIQAPSGFQRAVPA